MKFVPSRVYSCRAISIASLARETEMSFALSADSDRLKVQIQTTKVYPK